MWTSCSSARSCWASVRSVWASAARCFAFSSSCASLARAVSSSRESAATCALSCAHGGGKGQGGKISFDTAYGASGPRRSA
eukprot:9500817-Pyramimonas_sp.AAC.2